MASRTVNAWTNMKRRCKNPTHPDYKNYGGRGIKVCFEWEDFSAFQRDMGNAPEGMWLDRIDNDGNYCKENCRWVTPKESAANTRMRSTNLSGVVGVYRDISTGRWRAQAEGRSLYSGESFEAAVKARKDWEAQQCLTV